jgi:predicted LPLAT superfamily acyltransferase
MDGAIMTPGVKVGIAGIVIALILLIVGIPLWVVGALIVVALAIPVGGYLMLDKSQRRRAREVYRKRNNRGIGR